MMTVRLQRYGGDVYDVCHVNDAKIEKKCLCVLIVLNVLKDLVMIQKENMMLGTLATL